MESATILDLELGILSSVQEDPEMKDMEWFAWTALVLSFALACCILLGALLHLLLKIVNPGSDVIQPQMALPERMFESGASTGFVVPI